MCGIAGIYNNSGGPIDARMLEAMTQSQIHRGPDGEGYVFIDLTGHYSEFRGGRKPSEDPTLRTHSYSVAFGHRRLAVLDTSEMGHQPMATPDARYWVSYNGELYNYVELREKLKGKGYRFRSSSDTEVLLAAYVEWGTSCLREFNGMFAFAIWDGPRGQLFCARDRMGEKPFYYYWNGELLAFASEMKALLPTLKHVEVNQQVVYDYLEGGILDRNEQTFLTDIRQLLPGNSFVIRGSTLTLERYWSLPEEQELDLSTNDAREQFQSLFDDAVRIRLRSDVPVGSCLSGGLDSSSIVSAAMKHVKDPPSFHTFSSCFDNPAYDERPFIESIVDGTGVQPHFTFPEAKELLDSISSLIWSQDEPFGSTSIFAQWAVMRLSARHGIKVLLDGQGADELLAGYPRFFGVFFGELLSQGKAVSFCREFFAYLRIHGGLPKHLLAAFARVVFPETMVRGCRGRITGSRKWIHPEFHHQWAHNKRDQSLNGSAVRHFQRELLTGAGLPALLHSEDRNSMAFGIEARLPFLDVRLVEFLYRLGAHHKLKRGWTKVILRDAMKGILPENVRMRSDKMGFVTEEDMWFRTSLREWIRDILADDSTRRRGYLNVNASLEAFENHVSGRTNISRAIWRWVNLELWCRQFIDHRACAES